MAKWDTVTNYASAAADYERLRRPGPATVRVLRRVFSSVPAGGTVLSLGCGTGHYEDALFGGKGVVGLDKSPEMLRIARTRVERCVEGDMLDLPFDDDSFQGVYLVQSLHHVGANLSISAAEREQARKKTLAEAVRVLQSGPLAIVQRDPSQNEAIWFWRYFPEALATKLIIQPAIKTILAWLEGLGLSDVKAIPIDDPMIEGFYDAQAPLQPAFQRSFSEFSYLSAQQLLDGTERLHAAIRDGTVREAIETCSKRFAQIGGTVFVVSGRCSVGSFVGCVP